MGRRKIAAVGLLFVTLGGCANRGSDEGRIDPIQTDDGRGGKVWCVVAREKMPARPIAIDCDWNHR